MNLYFRRNDILVANDSASIGDYKPADDNIMYYMPLVQSASIKFEQEIATKKMMGKQLDIEEKLTSPNIVLDIESIAKEKLINNELYFFHSPTDDSAELPLFTSRVDTEGKFIIFLNEGEADDMIKLVENAGKEKVENYALIINRCLIDSYNFSVQTADVARHSISIIGKNFSARKHLIKEATYSTDLKPKRFGVFYDIKLKSDNQEIDRAVTSFNFSSKIDRLEKYTFKKTNGQFIIENNAEGLIPSKRNAIYPINCTINFSIIEKPKSIKDFDFYYIRHLAETRKNFEIVLLDKENSTALEESSFTWKFKNAILQDISYEMDIDGLLKVDYTYKVQTSINNDGNNVTIINKLKIPQD